MTEPAETVAIDMKIVNETDRAYLATKDLRRNAVWLPKSQVTVEDEFKVQEAHVVHVPVWLAEKNGLV